MEVSSTTMKVAMEMTAMMVQGLRLPATERSGVQPCSAPLPSGAGHQRTLTVGSTLMPGPEDAIRGTLVEHDLDRHALHHLHVIAGGVFRRQDAERLAGAALDGIDMAAKSSPPQASTDTVDRLAHPHQGELGFLEICRHPQLQRHDRHHLLARRDVIAQARRCAG